MDDEKQMNVILREREKNSKENNMGPEENKATSSNSIHEKKRNGIKDQ